MTSRHHGMQAVTLCISTTMVLILLGMVVLLVQAARNLSTYVKENMSVNLVLGDTVSVDDGKALVAELQARPYARHVTYISQEEALKTMTAELLGEERYAVKMTCNYQGIHFYTLMTNIRKGDYIATIGAASVGDKDTTEEIVGYFYLLP